MCWSGEASAALATIGLVATMYAAVKKEPPALWIPLGYFSLMEMLQAFTYSVIDQCSNPANQIATLLSYLHIVFQPIFINALALYFVPEGVRRRIAVPVYAVCFAIAVAMLLQLYPFPWAGRCYGGICSERLCSVHGTWHIAWEIPLNGIGDLSWHWYYLPFSQWLSNYWLAAFTMPLLYGSWRLIAYAFVAGPWLAGHLTTNPHEQPAIWCLLSIGLLLIVMKTPVRQWLHVRRWFWWPRAWRNS